MAQAFGLEHSQVLYSCVRMEGFCFLAPLPLPGTGARRRWSAVAVIADGLGMLGVPPR